MTCLSDPIDCFPDSVVPFPGFVDFILEALTFSSENMTLSFPDMVYNCLPEQVDTFLESLTALLKRVDEGKKSDKKQKKITLKAKIIANLFGQFEKKLYLCIKDAKKTSGIEICGIAIRKIFLSARDSFS